MVEIKRSPNMKNSLKKLLYPASLLAFILLTAFWVATRGSDLAARAERAGKDLGRFPVTACVVAAIVWAVITAGILLIKRKDKVEYLFAILYVVLGAGYMAVMPLSSVPDELSHFLRAYEISEGHFISERSEADSKMVGRELPAALSENWNGVGARWSDVEPMSQVVINEEETIFQQFPNTALYSPFSYLPQVVGISVAKLFTDHVMVIAYMGRFFAWLVVGIILFFSIRYIPVGKVLLMVLSLLPISMQESASLAADGLAYAICVAFVTFVLYMRFFYKEQMGKRHYVLLYLLVFYIATVKIVYMPLCLLAFLIPMERFGGRKGYVKHAVIAGALAVATCFVWLGISGSIMEPYNPGADPDHQMEYLLSKPHGFVGVLVHTIFTETDNYIKQMMGHRLGWLDIYLNQFLVFATFVLFIMVLIKERYVVPSEGLATTDSKSGACWLAGSSACKIFMWASVCCVVLLIFISLFIQWTPVGFPGVTGVQGRYFIPLVLPCAVACKGVSGNNDGNVATGGASVADNVGFSYGVALAMGAVNVCALVTMAVYFAV